MPGPDINDDGNGVGIIPREILVGVLVIVFTIIYIAWNRRAASRDAIAYAAKIRQQEVDKPTLEDGRRKECSTDTNASPGESQPSNAIAGEHTNEIKNDSVTGPGADIVLKEADNADDAAGDNPEDPANDENKSSSDGGSNADDDDDDNLFSSNNNQWRCACEGGFLPAGMLQSLGGAEAVFNMGIGACYHNKGEMK